VAAGGKSDGRPRGEPMVVDATAKRGPSG